MRRDDKVTRLVLIAAILAGVSYVGSWSLDLPTAASIAWKGAGVALLALYAACRARSLDGWLLTCVMAFGALGDALLDAINLTAGAAAFAVGHLIAIALYLRNRRPSITASQNALALVTLFGVPYLGWQLTGAVEVAFYSTLLALMASTAWLSRFPRYRTGIGAMMFVASDLLIFARMDVLAGIAGIGLAIWTLYFAGQVLICLGITGADQKP